jgi:hypothetical protein
VAAVVVWNESSKSRVHFVTAIGGAQLQQGEEEVEEEKELCKETS